MKVYLLWHVNHIEPDNDDEKLIGVYSSRASALRAKKRTAKLPGFRNTPRGFQISPYEIDKDHWDWEEGFITVRPGKVLARRLTILKRKESSK
jgi:hypothetical protein